MGDGRGPGPGPGGGGLCGKNVILSIILVLFHYSILKQLFCVDPYIQWIFIFYFLLSSSFFFFLDYIVEENDKGNTLVCDQQQYSLIPRYFHLRYF